MPWPPRPANMVSASLKYGCGGNPRRFSVGGRSRVLDTSPRFFFHLGLFSLDPLELYQSRLGEVTPVVRWKSLLNATR